MPNTVESLDDIIFSCFYADISVIEKALNSIFLEKIDSGGYLISKGILDLRLVNWGNPKHGAGNKQCVIYAPSSFDGMSVFVANSVDGWYTLVNRLCLILKARCISVASAEDAQYPANSLRVYLNGESVRYVRSMLDGDKWDFLEKGDLQSFEDLSNYQRRKIKERLNRKIICEYLLRIGINIADEKFWHSIQPAIYLREMPKR